jgi:hypothetical protein
LKAHWYVFLLLIFSIPVLSGCHDSGSSTLPVSPGELPETPPIVQAEATFDDATFDNATWD